jgi:thiol-disulfide isomerase/thioredoxin
VKTTSTIVQVGLIGLSAVAVYGFVRAAQLDERRSACTAVCAMAPAYAGRDKSAPDFELPDLTGKMTKLSSFRGKTVVLNFWTSTCGPCLEEMPSVAELAKMAEKRTDFVVVTVTIDEDPKGIRDALKVAIGGDIPFTVLIDKESKVVGDRFGTKLFPETWIIDPKGVIRARFDGARDWASALSVELAHKASGTISCPVEFFKSQPTGKFAALCEDDT